MSTWCSPSEPLPFDGSTQKVAETAKAAGRELWPAWTMRLAAAETALLLATAEVTAAAASSCFRCSASSWSSEGLAEAATCTSNASATEAALRLSAIARRSAALCEQPCEAFTIATRWCSGTLTVSEMSRSALITAGRKRTPTEMEKRLSGIGAPATHRLRRFHCSRK
eukprot:6181110-Pleurochrysis_carterae.AAC.2